MTIIENNVNKPYLLAVINPNSGSGKGVKTFRNVVEPIWRQHGISFEVLTTQYAGHCAQELAKDKNISRFSSIVAIGGDGTLAEIVNGLKENPWIKTAEKIISLGIIPVGSGNGLSKSLHFHANRPFNIQEAAKMTASTATQQLDLIEVTQKEKKQIGFLAVTLGLIADIDILSEPLRFLGDFRYTLGAIMCLWKNRAYRAKLSYLPESKEENSNSNNIPEPSAPLPNDFKAISGDFNLIMIGNTSHCSSNAHTAPGAKPDDGYLHVSAVRNASRWSLLKLLLKLDSDSWVQDPAVIRFKTKALRLEGLEKETILTLDGERIPAEPIQCRVHQAALKVLSGCRRKMP